MNRISITTVAAVNNLCGLWNKLTVVQRSVDSCTMGDLDVKIFYLSSITPTPGPWSHYILVTY